MEGGQQSPSLGVGAAGRQTRNHPKQTQKAAAASETGAQAARDGPLLQPEQHLWRRPTVREAEETELSASGAATQPPGPHTGKADVPGKGKPEPHRRARTISRPGGWEGLAGLRGRGGDPRPRLTPAGRKHTALGFWGTQVSLDSRGCRGRTEHQAPDWRDKCEFELVLY